jgi:hypothetical protein
MRNVFVWILICCLSYSLCTHIITTDQPWIVIHGAGFSNDPLDVQVKLVNQPGVPYCNVTSSTETFINCTLIQPLVETMNLRVAIFINGAQLDRKVNMLDETLRTYELNHIDITITNTSITYLSPGGTGTQGAYNSLALGNTGMIGMRGYHGTPLSQFERIDVYIDPLIPNYIYFLFTLDSQCSGLFDPLNGDRVFRPDLNAVFTSSNHIHGDIDTPGFLFPGNTPSTLRQYLSMYPNSCFMDHVTHVDFMPRQCYTESIILASGISITTSPFHHVITNATMCFSNVTHSLGRVIQQPFITPSIQQTLSTPHMLTIHGKAFSDDCSELCLTLIQGQERTNAHLLDCNPENVTFSVWEHGFHYQVGIIHAEICRFDICSEITPVFDAIKSFGYTIGIIMGVMIFLLCVLFLVVIIFYLWTGFVD